MMCMSSLYSIDDAYVKSVFSGILCTSFLYLAVCCVYHVCIRRYVVHVTAARDKGVYIVGACGFDSVPSDLGVEFVRTSMKDGTLAAVEAYLQVRTGKLRHLEVLAATPINTTVCVYVSVRSGMCMCLYATVYVCVCMQHYVCTCRYTAVCVRVGRLGIQRYVYVYLYSAMCRACMQRCVYVAVCSGMCTFLRSGTCCHVYMERYCRQCHVCMQRYVYVSYS